ncbi:DedA family protein [Pseudoalteromonas shioyasakiensis]|uniref:YqaA family protein n=1 Tax=Pseudoalteromonas shioyasakiensis TaxID=1190813 RepID=UPI002119018E|nr:YqaA family protein [Pseudoalteromonas shioyasakiensis]MCQ8879638.1 DedA family protein [Pseudoalteromonas shioyasakiensis]
MAYLSLFFTAFISATLLPSSSELVLTAMVTQGDYLLWLLWLTATVGNVLGSCVNYWLGTQVIRFKDRKWFPVSQASIDKAQLHFKKYGVYSLLFAWLPIIGDPLTVVGGIFKVRWWTFIWLVALGKGARYLVVLAFAIGIDKVI